MVYADRQPALRARARIMVAVRLRLAELGFDEVETPILQRSPGNEEHLEAFSTMLVGPDASETQLYLHTSPEFAMKSLLAAGERRIFTFAKVFRNRERTPTHHPEFTMLEWYRADEPYERLMQDCATLIAASAEAAGTPLWRFRDRSCDPFLPPERISVAEAFFRYAGIDLLATLAPAADRGRLAEAAQAAGIRIGATDGWSDIFSRILVERIEPHLGTGRPTILDRYPAPEAALARPCADDQRVAERFEVYACGVELANGFGELTDAVEQRRRFEAAMSNRRRHGAEAYPIDDDFLAALSIMPPASGIALGFDRLVMLSTGATRIDQVMWLPVVDPQAR